MTNTLLNWMRDCLRSVKKREVASIDLLLGELNVISFLVFVPVYAFLPASIALVIIGKTTDWLFYSVPWSAFAVVYLYWRMRHFRARCRQYSHAQKTQEYWKALQWDAVRILLIGGLVFSTLSPLMVKGIDLSLYVALFFGGVFLYSFVLGFEYLEYWGASRSSRK